MQFQLTANLTLVLQVDSAFTRTNRLSFIQPFTVARPANSAEKPFVDALGGVRSHDQRVKSPLLYQLSYEYERAPNKYLYQKAYSVFSSEAISSAHEAR